MKSDFEVIDNFLDPKDFEELTELFTVGKSGENIKMQWYYSTSIVSNPDEEDKKNSNQFYMTHTVYNDNVPMSDHFPMLFPILEKLNVIFLRRIKANLYPNTHELCEHSMHADMTISHRAAVFSLNTCDGYTKLEDGTKVNSVANRILLFDGSAPHCSTTTTNAPARININFNYK